jgi:hypothetical protein
MGGSGTGTPSVPVIAAAAGMDYYLLRKKFCELSGRYDLMNTDYTDNGADFFINAGQRHLDRLQSTGKMKAKNVQPITAGTIQVKVAGLRSVLDVFIGNTTEGLIKLQKASLSYLRQYYAEQLSGLDQGTPDWYAPAIFRPYADTLSLTGLYDVDDLIPATTGHYAYSGIIIAPPPDSTMYVIIYGTYYSPNLTATLAGSTWTQTKSFWTDAHPDILLQAALYKLETFYRNTEGAKDWKNALTVDILDMDKDAAEEEAAEISEMGG